MASSIAVANAVGDAPAVDASAGPAPSAKVNPHRISLPTPLRLPLFFALSSITGFGLGLAHGANETGLRFRAENAHRLPTTQTGWYLYHKSKNYVAMLGGIKEGFRMAGRLGVWTLVFAGCEESVDRARFAAARFWTGRVRGMAGLGLDEDEAPEVKSSKDFISTVCAGLGTAGLFSAWNRFPLATAARTAKMGAKAGLAFGLLQDAASFMRGRRLGYVEFVKRRLGVSE